MSNNLYKQQKSSTRKCYAKGFPLERDWKKKQESYYIPGDVEFYIYMILSRKGAVY